MASSPSAPPIWLRAFAAGHLHLLLLFGPPGVGKSRAVRQALDPHVGWISGQATPLGIYLEAFAFRGALSLEEAWAMARYLRTLVPGTETPRPDFKQKAENGQPAPQPKTAPAPGK